MEQPSAVPRGPDSNSVWWPVGPGQTGLHLFLKTNRSISANMSRIIHHLEPALKNRGITLRKTWRPGEHRLASNFQSCLASVSNSSQPQKRFLVPSSWRFCAYTGATFLCNQTTFCVTEKLLDASQVRTMAQVLKSKPAPTVMPVCYSTASKQLGNVCQNAGLWGWVGFCFSFISKLDSSNFIQTQSKFWINLPYQTSQWSQERTTLQTILWLYQANINSQLFTCINNLIYCPREVCMKSPCE